MKHQNLCHPGRGRARLSLLMGALALGAPCPARADGPPPNLGRAPLIPAEVIVQPASEEGPSSTPSPRLRLFRIQPGFLSDPIGAPPEEDLPVGDRVNFAFGNDNPHFDFRRRTDPGGLGFTRVNTQVLLFDSAATALSLGLQAVAPSGLEHDGLPDHKGPTVVTPALAVFHALDDHLALQAFVGKHVPVMNRAAQSVHTDLQCGMAVQGPLFADGPDLLRGLFVSVGALGQVRPERDPRSPIGWELMPGLHYRVADHWWISGGVSVPVGPVKPDAGQQWQVTCSLQF